MIIKKAALIVFLILICCWIPFDIKFDTLTGYIEDGNGNGIDNVLVFSSAPGYSISEKLSADMNHVFDSTLTGIGGQYSFKAGFPVEYRYKGSGCSINSTREVDTIINIEFILSFIRATYDTFSVLIIDTTTLRLATIAIDSNSIDLVLKGDNNLFNVPGELREIPTIILEN